MGKYSGFRSRLYVMFAPIDGERAGERRNADEGQGMNAAKPPTMRARPLSRSTNEMPQFVLKISQ
jgi:hypothetical protein